MATQATNVPIVKPGLRDRIDGFMTAISVGLTTYMEGRARVGQLEMMNAKTDEELATMGLKREDIPHYVFRDLLYL